MDIKTKQLRDVGNLAKSAIKPKPQYKGHIIKKKERKTSVFLSSFVRTKGLEPPRLTTLDPKSSAATNYATCARITGTKVVTFPQSCKYFCIKLNFQYSTQMHEALV